MFGIAAVSLATMVLFVRSSTGLNRAVLIALWLGTAAFAAGGIHV